MEPLTSFWNQLTYGIARENLWEILAKFLLALVLSGVIGIERQRKGRSAGLRTHILVCVGATLLILVNEYIIRESESIAVRVDRARMAAGIITGIGFLGAGAIMKSGQERVGLTTAATIWFSAAQGIAIGGGFIITAVIGTVVVLVVLKGLFAFEEVLPQRGYFLMSMQLPAHEANLGQIMETIKSQGPFEIYTTAVKSCEERDCLHLSFHIESNSTQDFSLLAALMQTKYAHAKKISLERLRM